MGLRQLKQKTAVVENKLPNLAKKCASLLRKKLSPNSGKTFLLNQDQKVTIIKRHIIKVALHITCKTLYINKQGIKII